MYDPLLQHLYCKAPYETGQVIGTWYAKFDGIFSVREFVLSDAGAVLVALCDMRFLAHRPHPHHVPEIPGVARMQLSEFEEVWVACAQAKLAKLGASSTAHDVDDVGNPIDPARRPTEITHAEFDAEWVRRAVPRLYPLANGAPKFSP